ncbi:MAG: GDSL-type esterase/lipase family protein [Dongiaceae bacterium]
MAAGAWIALALSAAPAAAAEAWRCTGPAAAGPTTTPSPRQESAWRQRLLAKNHILGARRFDLAFLGDSITERWDPAAWRQLVGARSAINLGFSGDRTENLLWRLENGELDGQPPRAFVLQIGTNNIGRHHPPEAVADGVRAVLELLRARVPQAPVLLVGILPRDESPDTPFRRAISATNRLLSLCADGGMVRFVDLGATLLDGDGRLPAAVAPDHLHFSRRGYALLSRALAPAMAGLP